MHTALQFVDFARCTTRQGIEEELAHLRAQGHLSPRQAEAVDPAMLEAPVESIMTRDVCSVDPDTPLAGMLGLMHERGINRLPVLDGGHVAGVVTRTDLLKVFGAIQ